MQHACGDTTHSMFHHIHRTYIMLATIVIMFIMQNILETKDNAWLLQPPICTYGHTTPMARVVSKFKDMPTS